MFEELVAELRQAFADLNKKIETLQANAAYQNRILENLESVLQEVQAEETASPICKNCGLAPTSCTCKEDGKLPQ